MRDLTCKNALLTGASRGIGVFIARDLARAKVNLVIVSRHASVDELGRVASELREFGVRVIPISADIRQAEARKCLIEQAQASLGSIDLLINSAGLEQVSSFLALSEDKIRALVETNLIAPIDLARLCLPGMLARHSGHIVSISSMAGKAYLPYTSVYSATKAGLNSWTMALRDELQGTGVSASVICPGFISIAGMVSRYHAPGLRTVSPQRVSSAVMDALQRDLLEVLVYPSPIRYALALQQLVPTMTSVSFKRAGLTEMMRQMAMRESE